MAGIVTELGFESGQDVPKGAKLVQLDISVEMADRTSAEATLREADVSYKRQTDLLTKAVTSKQASIRHWRSATPPPPRSTASRALIAQKAILAPFAGRLGIRKVEIGQYVSPGLALVTLQALDPIWVDFPMPEQNIGKLQIDQVIELTVDAFPAQVFKGEVPRSMHASRRKRAPARARHCPNPHSKLLPGMFANVAVLAGAPRAVISVPRTAITYSLYGDSVYVVKPPDGARRSRQSCSRRLFVIERRFVTLGQVRDDLVAVTSGLKAAEMVVTTGQVKLNNGGRVKIDNSQALQPPPELPKP